jgi:hypothetical protein
MIEVYHFGCAVGLALSSLGFGFGFGLGMYVAWVTERPDTPRVVSRGRWGVVPFFRTVGDGHGRSHGALS